MRLISLIRSLLYNNNNNNRIGGSVKNTPYNINILLVIIRRRKIDAAQILLFIIMISYLVLYINHVRHTTLLTNMSCHQDIILLAIG